MTPGKAAEDNTPGRSPRLIKSKEPEVPVYEGEIIDEDELTRRESTGRETVEAQVPAKKTRKFAYRLGRAAASAAVFLGFLIDIAARFRSDSRQGRAARGMGKGMGRGGGNGRGRGRRKRYRNPCK